MIVQWVAVDWGTTNLSAYAVAADEQVLDQDQGERGMSQLRPDQFEQALLKMIDRWLPNDKITPVIACGMVGAQQGWHEAPYTEIPCSPVAPETAISVTTLDPRISVQIVPGVCQRDPDDVMRGEETQIAGYFATEPEFEGVFCLPGTHSKWVQVMDGKIRNFTTFMTGELFGLLTRQSVLSFFADTSGWDDEAFLKAIDTAIMDPSSLTAKLFSLRPQALLSGIPDEVLKAHLSGLLIGAELAAVRDKWRSQDVVIIGDRENARLYHMALTAQGMRPKVFDAATAIVQGLRPIIRAPIRIAEPV